ncbi:MAG: hypothetical protein Q9183_005653, partial [Haloplaca sp. 2 TL-2023]
ITGDPSEVEQGAGVEGVDDAANGQQAVLEQKAVQGGSIEDEEAGEDDEEKIVKGNEDDTNSENGISPNRDQPTKYAFYPTPPTSSPSQTNASQINFVQKESAITETSLTATQPGPTFGVDYIAINSDDSESEDDDGDELYACSIDGEQGVKLSESVRGGNEDEDSTNEGDEQSEAGSDDADDGESGASTDLVDGKGGR